jgi:hypothetical protein
MQYHKKTSTILLVLTLVVSACAGNSEPTEDPQIVMTSAVGTMVAAFFETQTAMVTPSTFTPTATETKFPTPTSFATQGPILGLPTATFLFYTPTLGTPLSPTVTGTLPTATVNAAALGNGCYNLAFVRDVNYPNGTVVKPGLEFTKRWKVENNGTCDWMYVFKLVFQSGQNMYPYIDISGKKVPPGNWSELSVGLTAPKKPGTYSAYWRFSDGGGKVFGATLGITIKVEANTAVPSKTNTVAPVNTNTSAPVANTNTSAPANTSTTAPDTATSTVAVPTETPTP